MKRELLLIGCVAGVLAIGYCAAKAEQIVTINVVPQPTPVPTYRVDDELPTYKLDSSDVKRIAKLLWSSPLRSESEKTKLVWVVLNRVDHFQSTVHDIVNQDEFTFYDRHARVSDRNVGIVEKVMQKWLAEKDGHHIGRRPPKDALYIRFGGENNRKLDIMTESSGKALSW